MNIKIIKEERSTIGIKVRLILKESINAQSLHGYKANVEAKLEALKTGNHLKADLQYKLKIRNEFQDNEFLEVYHAKNSGSDTLIANVKRH